jgi:hypothetical protein
MAADALFETRGDRFLPTPLSGGPWRGVEHRFVRGSFSEPGPTTDWIRLNVPLLADEEISPLCRACAVADFGNGISGVLPPEGFTYVNPNLTVSLHRYPTKPSTDACAIWATDECQTWQPHRLGTVGRDNRSVSARQNSPILRDRSVAARARNSARLLLQHHEMPGSGLPAFSILKSVQREG